MVLRTDSAAAILVSGASVGRGDGVGRGVALDVTVGATVALGDGVREGVLGMTQVAVAFERTVGV